MQRIAWKRLFPCSIFCTGKSKLTVQQCTSRIWSRISCYANLIPVFQNANLKHGSHCMLTFIKPNRFTSRLLDCHKIPILLANKLLHRPDELKECVAVSCLHANFKNRNFFSGEGGGTGFEQLTRAILVLIPWPLLQLLPEIFIYRYQTFRHLDT